MAGALAASWLCVGWIGREHSTAWRDTGWLGGTRWHGGTSGVRDMRPGYLVTTTAAAATSVESGRSSFLFRFASLVRSPFDDQPHKKDCGGIDHTDELRQKRDFVRDMAWRSGVGMVLFNV